MKLLVIENPRPLSIEHYNDVANAPLSASLNSGYALAIARRAEWDTVHLDFTASQNDAETMTAAILAAEADLILFHWVYSWGHEAVVCRIMDLVRRTSDTLIGTFGLFPTLSRTRLFAFAPQLDFILPGEFEQTLEELLRSFTHDHPVPELPGLARRGVPYVPRELPDYLSWLPVPDDVGTNCSYTTMNIAASRGCFGVCRFCFISRYYGCSRRRERDCQSLEAEIETRRQRRAIDQLYFVDPTFMGYGTRQKERIAAIGALAKGTGLLFGLETRVDTIDEERVALLEKYGAASIFLGIESGCDSVLRRLNKRITTEQIARAVQCVRASGIRLNLGFIMFEPDSTLDELAENYAFLEKLGLLDDHELTANLLYHSQITLYGSAAWERLEGEGRLIRDDDLPFEAKYRFKDESVARVCRTMRRLASEYFLGMDDTRRGGGRAVEGVAVNGIMKEAFRSTLHHVERSTPQEYERREERFLADLSKVFKG